MTEIKNPHAQALGRLGKGKPKNFTPEELKLRSERMKKINLNKKEKNEQK
jgi:hypothetical protein